MAGLPPKEAEVLATDSAELFQLAVKRAAAALRAGEVVALPTETVYGLAANALDPEAVSRIFAVKGRPAHNPIIVHAADEGMARRCASDWPPVAARLARSFWPGPLTLVLPKSIDIPNIVTAGGPTVGIRWPSHPFIQAVIQACGFPLAAPSANLSNKISPTTATHVRRQLGDKIHLIVDGGPAQVGIESTVLDLTVSPPRLLRPGMIHEQALMAVTGELRTAEEGRAVVLKSPGRLAKHYSPRAKLVIWTWANDQDLQRQWGRSGLTRKRIHVVAHTRIPSGEAFERVSVIPHDPEAFARAIYAELHQCDELGAEMIIVEALPETSEWGAVRDRLNRAAA